MAKEQMPSSDCEHCVVRGWHDGYKMIVSGHKCDIDAWHAFRKCTKEGCLNYKKEELK